MMVGSSIGIGYYMLVVFGILLIGVSAVVLLVSKKATGKKGTQTYLGGESIDYTGIGANYYQPFEKAMKGFYPYVRKFHDENATSYLIWAVFTLVLLMIGGLVWL